MTQLDGCEDKITPVHTGVREPEAVQARQDLLKDEYEPKHIGYNNKPRSLGPPPPIPPRSTRPDYVPPATRQREVPGLTSSASRISPAETTLHESGVKSTPLSPPGLPPRSTCQVSSTAIKQDAMPGNDRRLPSCNTDDVATALDRSFAGLSLESNLAVPMQTLGQTPSPDLRSTRSLPALTVFAAARTHQTSSPRPEREPSAPVTPSKTKMRFYSVVVGKKTGVFTDWNFAAGLVLGVPGSRYKGFKTEAEAYANYNGHKQWGTVEVVRVSKADDEVYGPIESAME